MKDAYLVLSNGMVFEGKAIGYQKETVGELVFTTGMVGYMETLTDPSYAGQIVTQTFPLIGNYGVIPEDFEGETAVRGYVVRELCEEPSNFRSEYELQKFLEDHEIPGICGVDTRELTRILREEGVMNAKIVYEMPECMKNDDFESGASSAELVEAVDEELLRYTVSGVVHEVSCKEAYTVSPEQVLYKVVLIDYGAKKNIVRSLVNRGCEVTVVPESTSAEEVLAMNPDGIMLSNGPGDPAENVYCIEQIRQLVGKVPVFGICLGHQLTALAMGGKTMKLKYGHRGANQPVREVMGTRTYITSQNHGYAVVAESLKGIGEETYRNANDGSNEGMIYPGKKCFTVQFHPEACGGPKDTDHLFDRLISMMGGND